MKSNPIHWSISSPRSRGVSMDFFEANRKLLGDDAVTALEKLNVLIVGAGGLGGYVANGLTRLGVGNLTIIDMDTYEMS
ncbi:MAG: ThiF family adenylyltransferase, partial [Bacillota bacterium]